jgi:hypothetical protein
MTDTQALDTTDITPSNIITNNVHCKTPSYTLKAIMVYEEKNKDKMKEYRKQYYQKNKEEIKLKRAARKLKNNKNKEQIDTLTENIDTTNI